MRRRGEHDARGRGRRRRASAPAPAPPPADDESSDAANDDADAVYTYRGDEPPEPAEPPLPRPPSSPDMDFLEMDFDPGPPDDAPKREPAAPPPEPEPEPEPRASTSGCVERVRTPPPLPPPPPPPPPAVAPRCSVGQTASMVAQATAEGGVVWARRTVARWPPRELDAHHAASGDLVSPGELGDGDLPESFSWNCIGGVPADQAGIMDASRINLSSQQFHYTMAKKLVFSNHAAKFLQEHDTSNVDGEDSCNSGEPPIVPKCMIWNEQEACSRQVTQIGTSACGATAVINVMLAFKQTVDVEKITTAVNTRQRANGATLCKYIISRAIAGCSVRALTAGLHAGSDGRISSRHFPTSPERCISLSHWLAYWIKLGGVPIATLNLQAGITDPAKIPDSWHHQMIFGVGPRGIYMTNPIDCVEEGALWHQLCSESVLLIKRKDILSRWTNDTDLSPLMDVPGDERWKSMNVLGQVVNMVRESQQNAYGFVRTTHIKIPACYSAGITIAVLSGTDTHKKLISAPELPLLYTDDE